VEFGVRNGYCVWIENVETDTLELIYIIIRNSRDCDIENVISRPVMIEIV